MNIIKTNLVLLRNIYQSQINTNITSIFMNNDDISSPLFKPFYLDLVNYIPFFILKNILGIYEIDYLYETDGTIWNNTSDNIVKIAPLILSFEILDENNNSILNLKEVSKDYSNDMSKVRNIVHFTRYKFIEKQLQVLTIEKLNLVVSEIFKLEKKCKIDHNIANLLIKKFLISYSAS